MKIEIEPPTAESVSAAEAAVVSGAADIGGALRRGSWHWKFRPALVAVFSGPIIGRLALAARLEVQRRATVVAELRARRIDVAAKEALEREH
jgi:hypothetical protein